MNRLVLALVTVFLAVTVLACGKTEEPPSAKKPVTEKQVQKETGEAVESLKAYTEKLKETYQKKVTDHLADMQKKMAELKGKVEKAAPELKSWLQKEIATMQQRVDALEKKLKDVTTASDKAWEELQGGINQALETWQKSYDESEKEAR